MRIERPDELTLASKLRSQIAILFVKVKNTPLNVKQ
jgi:hypothetical protein